MYFQEINFHKNYKRLGEFIDNPDSFKDKQEAYKCLNEMFFYANNLDIESREAQAELHILKSRLTEERMKELENI